MGLFGNHSNTTELRTENQQLRQRIDTLTENLQAARARYDQASVHIQKLFDDDQRLIEQNHQLSAWNFFEKDEDPHCYVYELRLADNCYYVGSTSRLRRRLQEHFMGENENGFKCAYWTTAHHPLKVIGLTEFPSDIERPKLEKAETQATLRLMRQYGYQAVRGGAFTATKASQLKYFLSLPDNQHKFGYTAQEVGITPTTTPSTDTPTSSVDYLIKYLPKQRQSAIMNAPADAIIAITISQNNNYLLFHRLRKSLNFAFKRLATDNFNITPSLDSGHPFTTVQEAVILTDCANSHDAEAYLDCRQKELEKNKHVVFRESYSKQ